MKGVIGEPDGWHIYSVVLTNLFYMSTEGYVGKYAECKVSSPTLKFGSRFAQSGGLAVLL